MFFFVLISKSFTEWLKLSVTEVLDGRTFYAQNVADKAKFDNLMKEINVHDEHPADASFKPKVGCNGYCERWRIGLL